MSAVEIRVFCATNRRSVFPIEEATESFLPELLYEEFDKCSREFTESREFESSIFYKYWLLCNCVGLSDFMLDDFVQIEF